MVKTERCISNFDGLVKSRFLEIGLNKFRWLHVQKRHFRTFYDTINFAFIFFYVAELPAAKPKGKNRNNSV